MNAGEADKQLSDRGFNAILKDWRSMLRFPFPDLAEMLLKLTNDRAAPWATRAEVETFLRTIYRQTPRSVSEETFEVAVDYFPRTEVET